MKPLLGHRKGHGGVVWEGASWRSWQRHDRLLSVQRDHDIFLYPLQFMDHVIFLIPKNFSFQCFRQYPKSKKSRAAEFLLRRLQLWVLCLPKPQFPHLKKWVQASGRVGY